jgi:hypothetical protein
MHGTVGIGEGAGFLPPGGRGQHHISQRGRLGQENVLHDEEQSLLGQDRADSA